MNADFETIYRNHRQGLFTLALSITRKADMAEDAVQEGFVRLFARDRQPTGDPVAYAFATVRNAAIDQARRRRPVGEAIYNGQVAAQGGPESAAVAAERDQIMRQAMDELPEQQRQAVVLKISADLTFEQITQVVGAPLGTVTSRYHRAIEKMRQRLGSCVGS